ncbi:phytochelatin synthase family protein [Sphingomonas sp. SUN019]|uniref:phytochelatin synthase family protein n=1 Tax=Sphingomonas sp. SUN019 TaxID=2937788 RepID=UPI002164D6DB|nr:phytochelatin synthase family protein [Sphingomonas sp. SUN019]UVO51748.1 phytochelatin synthase family protein [Sphingomonas sp. SUN019]
MNDATFETRRRRLLRRTLFAFLALLLLIVTVGAIIIGPLLFAPNNYAGVPSIERRADYRSPALMKAAWTLPVARTYARNRFEFQDNPSFCGPTSVANLLHSIGIPLSQHSVIDGTPYDPWFGVLIGGMTLDDLARLLAMRTKARVQVVRDPTLAQFRALMTVANDPRRRMIVNFHRGPMFGRGHGHFSPVLGFLADRDLVLVGDVNADYGPYLTPVDRLWRATDTIDDATGKERGLIVADVSAPKTAGLYPPRMRR